MRASQTKDNKLFFKPQGDHLFLGSLLNLLRDKQFLPSIWYNMNKERILVY